MELDITELLKPNKPASIWEDYVPIEISEDDIKIYITEPIIEPSSYNEACSVIENAKRYQKVTLILNCGGGNPDSAFMINDAIARSKAKVTARLVGTVASAATIITMACDNIDVAKNVSFMVHNYSASYSGKANELKALQNFADNELTEEFKEIYKGFLNKDELQKIIDGHDHWMGAEEVRKRWKEKTTKNSKPK